MFNNSIVELQNVYFFNFTVKPLSQRCTATSVCNFGLLSKNTVVAVQTKEQYSFTLIIEQDYYFFNCSNELSSHLVILSKNCLCSVVELSSSL